MDCWFSTWCDIDATGPLFQSIVNIQLILILRINGKGNFPTPRAPLHSSQPSQDSLQMFQLLLRLFRHHILHRMVFSDCPYFYLILLFAVKTTLIPASLTTHDHAFRLCPFGLFYPAECRFHRHLSTQLSLHKSSPIDFLSSLSLLGFFAVFQHHFPGRGPAPFAAIFIYRV